MARHGPSPKRIGFLRGVWRLVTGSNVRQYDREGLESRIRAQRRLDSTAKLRTNDVALLVLDNELRVVQQAIEANRSLETKANGLAVLDLALLGVLVTVCVEHRTSFPWLAAIAFVGFLLSLLCAWLVNRVV